MKVRVLVFIFFQLATFTSYSQSLEYTMKAAFIEKFARFTEWKGGIENEYFVIDILGESPFTGELEKLTKNLKVKNKPIKINYIKSYSEANNCQILFVCTSEKSKIEEIIKHFENLNILIIADTPGFCKKGVHTNFYIDNEETIKFEINLKALAKSNLSIDMQVLSLGKIFNKN